MKTYKVKEVFYTLQGEGAHTGRPAVFCRFSGCNLWSGREKDRASAICKFCDTKFVGGKKYTCDDLAAEIQAYWGPSKRNRFVVLTGGEPALQVDRDLVNALHDRHFFIAIETNGTIPLPSGIDWVCVSPKAGTEVVVTHGDELKLIFPQEGLEPEDIGDDGFHRYYLQPMDGPNLTLNTLAALGVCLNSRKWRLSQQTHKTLRIA